MATSVQLKAGGMTHLFKLRLVCILVSLLWFAGCVSVPVEEPDDQHLSTWQRKEERLGHSPDSTPVTRSSLVDSLQRSARERAAVGQWDQAEALVLRALRIEPQAADLYLQLAELKNRQGDASSATEIARKGLTYADSGSAIALDLQRLVQPE
ncbi:MAG: hypothetical protein WD668_12120 [Saccharospirillum sp.]